ncbi:MAG: protein kinase [Rubripirellula sp.]
MIAKQNHYEPDQLKMLLDDRLPLQEARQVETHLSRCASCQQQLQRIAGAPEWWNETVEVLSESTVGATRLKLQGEHNGTIPLRSLDASLDWIQPLLESTETGRDGVGSIGRIDQYPIQGVIGQGGMGVVLRGIDTELNRPVAIKILSPHLAGVGAARARFMREAKAAAAIVHPAVVPIYSVVPTARLPYLVMPCIGGGNLQQRIDREGPLELTEVLRIGLQVADGLAAAHRVGVIHRDIKPANILIEEGNGRVLISDFGLARALDDATLTTSGMIAGTPQYMSPEQARGESIDGRSDLFSLGSLLYALSTGRPPFRAETPLGVLRKITETQPKPISEINERVPGWFDSLVAQLMQGELSRRISSAEEAASVLRVAHAHVENPTRNALPSSLRQNRRRTRWWALASAVTVMIAGAAFLTIDAGPGSDSGPRFYRRTVQSDALSRSQQQQPPILPDSLLTPVSTEDENLRWHGMKVENELRAMEVVLDQLSDQLERATTNFQEQAK